jgi:hypothetical protein
MLTRTDVKIGDTLRVRDDYKGYMRAKPGATARVVGFDRNYVTIAWDRKNDLCGNQMDGNYTLEAFELATSAGEFILIQKDTYGAYAPAAKPKVYTSEAQALAVAEKMAAQHGGEFVVFKAFAASEMPKPVPVKPTTRRFA